MKRTLAFSACLLISSIAYCAPMVNADLPFPEMGKANAIVQAFQEKYQLPGISLAISYNNNLVYAVASGYSDLEGKKGLPTG